MRSSALEVATAADTGGAGWPAAARSVEQAVHRPTAGAVVGPVGYDRLLGGFAEPHGAQRLMHGRADGVSGQVAFGYWGTSVVERVSGWIRFRAPSRSAMPSRSKIAAAAIHPATMRAVRRAWRRQLVPARGYCIGHDPIVVD